MITFEDAYKIVMDAAVALEAEAVSLRDAPNRILARDVASDIDIPPFDKSAMDGYACRREDLDSELTVIEEIPAGYVPRGTIERNQCAKIMTGGMIPRGADCVVMLEQTRMLSGNRIVFEGRRTGSYIRYRSEDVRKGDVVLRRGTRLGPQHVALLATVGCPAPIVSRRPRVGVIATGNELVEPDQAPAGPQIRSSNGYQVYAHAISAGALPAYYGIARDTERDLDRAIRKAMAENDVVILSGGVSMGDYDLVPGRLRQNGFGLLFERVELRPGRPTVFGVSGDTFCFGLPGNPVSTFVTFELLVKPFLFKITGHTYRPVDVPMRLDKTFTRGKTDRKAWIPVARTKNGGAEPLEYHGSGHLSSLSRAYGLLSVPEGVSEIKEGELVDVRPI
jgi:molybdopterin molybdotransferase